MNKVVICKDCGVIDRPYKNKKSNYSFSIDFFLFLLAVFFLFIMPLFSIIIFIMEIIYFFSRSNTTTLECRKCDSKNIVPIDSPLGKKLAKELNKDIDINELKKEIESKSDPEKIIKFILLFLFLSLIFLIFII